MKTLMDSQSVREAIKRIARAIKSNFGDKPDIILIGIVTRGVCIAERIKKELEKYCKIPEVGSLDITFYRDDVGSIAKQPLAKETRLPVDINGRTVILVDDVLFTGRSIRAALDELMDFGRPASVQLAVLVDRGHRELPIQADYTGEKITTRRSDEVKVSLAEIDGRDEVSLV
ncbi:MAG: bifunctional pyr operon transcriptional regulator/uracil phosphoribosyltransferase PyrR [Elusimicrobiota bacterium]